MPKVLRTVLLTILLTAGALLSGADLLDTLGEQLDKLEPRFWPALARSPDSDYHKQTKELLRETMGTCRDIQRELSRQGIRFEPNTAGEMMKLQRMFDEDVKRSMASCYTVRIPATGMTAYDREFQRLQSRQGKRKVDKKTASLSTVDPDAYENWLNDQVNRSLKQIRRSSGDRNARQDENMKSKVTEFCEAVAKIRVALVRLRQEVKLQFR